VAKVGLLAVL